MPFICHQICIHTPLTHKQWSIEHNTVFEKHKITNFFCAPLLKKHERSASVSCPCFDSAHNKIQFITEIIIIHAATSQHMGCYQECQQNHYKHLPQRIRPFRLWSSGIWQYAIAQTGFTTLNKPHASTFRIIQEYKGKRSPEMLSTYQITQDQTAED
jgi:hypothetical protein